MHVEKLHESEKDKIHNIFFYNGNNRLITHDKRLTLKSIGAKSIPYIVKLMLCNKERKYEAFQMIISFGVDGFHYIADELSKEAYSIEESYLKNELLLNVLANINPKWDLVKPIIKKMMMHHDIVVRRCAFDCAERIGNIPIEFMEEIDFGLRSEDALLRIFSLRALASIKDIPPKFVKKNCMLFRDEYTKKAISVILDQIGESDEQINTSSERGEGKDREASSEEQKTKRSGSIYERIASYL